MKLVHIKSILFTFFVLVFMGCIKQPTQKNNMIALQPSEQCMQKAKNNIQELIGSQNIYLSHNIFQTSNILILSTQKNLESFINTHQISKTFILQQENGSCYIGVLEHKEVKKRNKISCDCIHKQDRGVESQIQSKFKDSILPYL